jgi:hypothetical protein
MASRLLLWGIFALQGKTPREHTPSPAVAVRIRGFFSVLFIRMIGACLEAHRDEHAMFRTTMIAVLLTLAIGQNSGLVCRMWCDLDVVIGTACPHEETASAGRTAVNGTCNMVDGEAAVFIREDGRRGPLALDPVPVLAVAALLVPPAATTRAHLPLAAARALPSAARPILALRI